MAADTSSAAAASRRVVWAAAATLASLIVEPMLANSPAAAVNASGAAVTNEIRGSYRDLDRYPVFHTELARADDGRPSVR